jgi:sugar phosphate isomerase/epimerase
MSKMNRRDFVRATAVGATGLMLSSTNIQKVKRYPVRLGGFIFKEDLEPQAWIQAHKELGYSAAYCPVEADASDQLVHEFENEAKKAGLIIAEVGAWSNPISPDEKDRKAAFDLCCAHLDLADRIGANCCVNIAGSRDPGKWDGPHADNLTDETFDLIVEVTRSIIDSVKPVRTFWTLETMPHVFPDSVESYAGLFKAIDRKRFAVHLDPVNLVNSPSRCFRNGELIRKAFKTLGPYIKSCHAKDICFKEGFPVNLQVCQPGLGRLDYAVYLDEVSRLPQSPPLMLEHLEEPQEYTAAAKYIRGVAQDNGWEILSL